MILPLRTEKRISRLSSSHSPYSFIPPVSQAAGLKPVPKVTKPFLPPPNWIMSRNSCLYFDSQHLSYELEKLNSDGSAPLGQYLSTRRRVTEMILSYALGKETPHPARGHLPDEPRSSRREEAHSNLGEASESLLTSAATVQGFNTRMLSGNSHFARRGEGRKRGAFTLILRART